MPLHVTISATFSDDLDVDKDHLVIIDVRCHPWFLQWLIQQKPPCSQRDYVAVAGDIRCCQ